MVLSEAIAKRSARVAELLRALNACETAEEARLIHADALLENGFVRSDAAKLVSWCKVAKAVGLVPEHRVPVPAQHESTVAAVVKRAEAGCADRFRPELVLVAEDRPWTHDARMKAAGDHSLDEEDRRS